MMRVTRRWTLSALVLVLLSVATLGAVKLVAANSARADCPGQIVCPETGKLICRDKCPMIDQDRADCPGKITCPQTGELICRDKCPTADPNRADCSGRVVCPLTGKLVCKDRCPLQEIGTTADTKQPLVPSCCAKKG